MEEGIEKTLNQNIKEVFSISDVDVRSYSPLTLAYIGDAVFELVIRSIIVDEGNRTPNMLHRHTSHIVKASSQAKIILALADSLSEEEKDIYRRGRNAKSNTMAKNQTMQDYRNATGLEALMGYLYLNGRRERILELIKKGLEMTRLKI